MKLLLACLVAPALAFVGPAAALRSAAHRRCNIPHAVDEARDSKSPAGQTELQTPEELAESIIANVFEGSWGSRGELWVLGQAVIIGSVIAAPDMAMFSVATRLSGILVILFGLAIAVVGAADLGPSLSPWPRPIAANELRTDGIFSLCRHPMYCGYLCGAGGFGLLTDSSERLLLSFVLYAMLSAKATREEDWMREKHGMAYDDWAATVPRFFPKFDSLRGALASFEQQQERGAQMTGDTTPRVPMADARRSRPAARRRCHVSLDRRRRLEEHEAERKAREATLSFWSEYRFCSSG